jgi:CheY-like chemotaxis protein
MTNDLPLASPTIVVVEDDPIQQRLLGVVLREEGGELSWRGAAVRRDNS